MHKSSKYPHSSIADREWLVYEDYEFGIVQVQQKDVLRHNQKIGKPGKSADDLHKNIEVRSIVKIGRHATSYSLSDPKTYEELLWDYQEIRSAEDALNYVKRRGFLGSDFEPNPEKPINKSCPVNEMLDLAAYLRWLITLSDAINKKEVHRLNSYTNATPIQTDMLMVSVRDKNDPNIDFFKTVETIAGYIPIRTHEETLLYTEKQWKRFGNQRGLWAAQDYLRMALRRLLIGIQPTLDWKQTLDGELVLEECMLITTPWQAICYALLLYFTGKTHFVSCLNCTNRFRAKRKDHSYCSEKCSRAHHRKYGQSVHSYTRKNEE
jgi:hypothetical protein